MKTKHMVTASLFGVVLVGGAVFTNCSKAGDTVTIVVDSTVPTVSSTSPVSNAVEVAIDAAITATFSETMDSTSVATAFTVGGVIGSVSTSATVSTFVPSGNLDYATTYTATISTGAKDVPGNALVNPYTWSFTTVSHGSLDTSFNLTGKTTTFIGGVDDYPQAMALQADGKIVVAGYAQTGINYDFALVRYNANGSLDTTFSTDGKATAPVGADGDFGRAVAIQSDGKIVVAGGAGTGILGTNDDFALARFNTDGSLDTTFNGTGKIKTSIGSTNDYAYAVAIQTDGKIVAAGYSHNGTNKDIALVRYNTNGSLDTSFNGTGKVTTIVGSGNEMARAIAIQTDGKIVAAGETNNGANLDFAIVRYNTNGTLDTSFNVNGRVITAISVSESAYGVVVQTDGKIIAAGYTYTGTNNVFALARYNTNGSLDTTFDTDGKVTTAIGAAFADGMSVTLQTNGKIVVAGDSRDTIETDFALVRYNTNGSLDTTFDTDGILTTPIGNGDDSGSGGVAIQADGKIVVGGATYNGTDLDFAVARYWP